MWIAYDRSNFIFTLLLAELLVCSKFKKRSFFWLRLACGGALLLVLSFFWTTGGEGMLGIASGAFKFLGLFLLSFALLLFCCKCDVWSILFAAAAGYCIQHIAYQAHSVVGILAGDLPQWGQAAALAACCAAAYAALYFLFVRKLKYRDGGVYINNMVMLWTAAIIIVIAVFVSFYGAVYSIDAGSGVLLAVVCFFSIFSCLLAIMCLKALNAAKEGEYEREVLQQMLYQAKLQYDISKDNIDIINIKCHDLKHKILSLKGNVDTDELDKISTAVDIYDRSFDTGNKALDVVLTEKSLLCRGKGIRLTCMLDGSVLQSWRPGDIYSFFGNALDNAVNSVSELPEEKRSVSITQARRGGLVSIRMENYYASEIRFEDGLPVTSGDRRYHGFGMKSIRMVAESYGCDVRAETADDVFRLTLLVAQ